MSAHTQSTTLGTGPAKRDLARYGAFAAVVAAAGIPLYIHLPAFLAERYGIGLEVLGVVLLAMRLIDFVQDPLLGWVLSRFGARRDLVAGLAALGLGAGMVGLFAVSAPVLPLLWVTLCLICTFTGFSLLTILIYADGVRRGGKDHQVRVAAWREAGALTGITAACLLPFALPGDGYIGFALVFAGVLALATLLMRQRWHPVDMSPAPMGPLFRDRVLRRFLLLAFLNAAPVAVTSTVFVFFVDSRLDLAELTGVFLVLFFLAAAASTLLWRAVAARIGAVRALMAGMALAIVSFVWAYSLGPGDAVAFALICAISGVALGADMMLLPALFSAYQAKRGGDPALAFGFWAFAGKATLAVSAGVVLPLLGWVGFQPGDSNTPEALNALSATYALLPVLLKIGAMGMLLALLPSLGGWARAQSIPPAPTR